jgi:hypothetical protein
MDTIRMEQMTWPEIKRAICAKPLLPDSNK